MSHIAPEQLSAYLDGEVTAEERILIETHLQMCDICRADVESLRWTVGLVRTLPSVEVPRPFYVREADLAPRPAPAGTSPARLLAGFFRALSYASAAGVVLSLFLVIFSSLGGGMQAVPQAAQQPPSALSLAPEAADVQPTATPFMRALSKAEPGEEQVTAASEARTEIEMAPTPPPEEQKATPPPETGGRELAESRPAAGGFSLTPWHLLLVTALATLVFRGLARWLSAR